MLDKHKLYLGIIIATGLECHISPYKNNNTPVAGVSVYLLYRCFLYYQDCCFVGFFDFQCLPFAPLKKYCVTVLILENNSEISNVSYSEWCGYFLFCLFIFFGLRWFNIVFVTIVHCNFILQSRGWTI